MPRKRKITPLWTIALLVVAGVWPPLPVWSTAPTAHQAPGNDLQTWFSPVLTATPEAPVTASGDPIRPVVQFYRQMEFQPVWVGPEGLLPQGKRLLNAMAAASATGLFTDSNRFAAADMLTGQMVSLDEAGIGSPPALHIQLDVMLTQAVLRLAQHLSQGRVQPETLDRQWLALRRPSPAAIPEELAAALQENRLEAYLESLHPSHRAYNGLRRALQDHFAVQRSGGWPTIASGPALRQGDTGERVSALKQYLRLSEDLCRPLAAPPHEFDEEVERAVKRFQERHGLTADGIVGKQTLAALNVPIEQRILQLRLNMERWRWYPDNLGDRYILANIPAFELSVIEGQVPIERMRAIMGRQTRRTPVFSGRLTYLELNPYWNVPRSIARRDILPKAIADPTYLTRNGIRVLDGWERQARELDPMGIAWPAFASQPFPYRLRQDPSAHNALGRIKFMFPNSLSIYIHDTPGKTLFDKEKRMFSSGCVRVEEPVRLAQHLLKGQGWDHARLEDAIASGKRRTVVLNQPLPVHLVYFTAWVDENERVHFREDIYGQDPILLAALDPDGSESILWVQDAGLPQLTTQAGVLTQLASTPTLSAPPQVMCAATTTPAAVHTTPGM